MSVMQLILLVLLLKQSSASFNVYNENGDFDNYFINKVEDVLSYNKNISYQCSRHMNEYINGLKSQKQWAAKMLDSGSKIPTGIIKGNLMDLGVFDECLEVEGEVNKMEKIYGKYCIGSISLKKMASKFPTPKLEKLDFVTGRATTDANVMIELATCLPNSCSSSDMEEIYASIIGTDVLTFNEELCQSKFTQPELNWTGIAALTFFGVISGLLLVSTSYDVVIHYLEAKPAHSLFVAFSLFTNGKKLLSTSKGANQINCLHGLRVISTMWVIFSHSYVVLGSFPLRNSAYLIQWVNNQFNMIVMGATVSVDTFFLMSGLVITYIYMGAVAKGTRFNIPLYYLHRYLRLTPSLAVVVLIYVTLLKHMGSGPLWPSTVDQKFIQPCEISWWKSLLYIQNYGGLRDMCINQTWYLAVDTQLFLFSPIILIPLKYWPKPTLLATGILALLSILGGFLDAWFREYGINIVSLTTGADSDIDYMKYHYVSTWARASPWLFGLILGYIIYTVKQRKEGLIINKVVVFLLWTISLIILFLCVFGGHDVFIKPYDKVQSSFYISLVRPSWSLAVAWIILACVTGYGGPVNSFLSLPIFQVLSKLTFTLYLVHFAVLYIVHGQMRDAPTFDNSYMLHSFWGSFIYCLIASLLLTITFESPMITIEKVIFGGGARKTNEQHSTDVVETYKKSGEIV